MRNQHQWKEGGRNITEQRKKSSCSAGPTHLWSIWWGAHQIFPCWTKVHGTLYHSSQSLNVGYSSDEISVPEAASEGFHSWRIWASSPCNTAVFLEKRSRGELPCLPELHSLMSCYLRERKQCILNDHFLPYYFLYLYSEQEYLWTLNTSDHFNSDCNCT